MDRNLLFPIESITATRALEDADFEEGTPKWGSARFSSRTDLVIGVEGEIRSFAFDANAINKLVIGRGDSSGNYHPEVDLIDYNAVSQGVSRNHAYIARKDGSLYLVDNNSGNGTYLNGQKLVAMQPRVLRDGDEIRLGHLVMLITFESA
jgi:hypothetical protein